MGKILKKETVDKSVLDLAYERINNAYDQFDTISVSFKKIFGIFIDLLLILIKLCFFPFLKSYSKIPDSKLPMPKKSFVPLPETHAKLNSSIKIIGNAICNDNSSSRG